jgi:hypothetical protein
MRPPKIKNCHRVAFSPDGLKLLCIGKHANLWSIRDQEKQWRAHPFSNPSNAAFSPDGTSIAIKNTEGRIVVLHTASGEIECDFRNQAEGEGSNVLYTPSGEQVIDGSWGGLLTVRSRHSCEIHFQTRFQGEQVSRIHQPGDARFLISEHHPRATAYDKPPADCYFLRWLWPVGNAEPSRMPFTFPFVSASALSHSGRCLAVVYGAPQDRMVLLELDSGAIRWTQAVQIGGTGSMLRWSSCDRFIGAVQKDQISIYQSEDGARIRCHPIQYPSDIDFSPDASLVALGSWREGSIEAFVPDNQIPCENAGFASHDQTPLNGKNRATWASFDIKKFGSKVAQLFAKRQPGTLSQKETRPASKDEPDGMEAIEPLDRAFAALGKEYAARKSLSENSVREWRWYTSHWFDLRPLYFESNGWAPGRPLHKTSANPGCVCCGLDAQGRVVVEREYDEFSEFKETFYNWDCEPI